MTYIDDLKCENFVCDMDSYFPRAKVDIIYYQCRGNKSENRELYYQTIYDKDFVNYENHVRNEAVSTAIKCERDDIHFKRDFSKRHIKRNVGKDLMSNGFFIKKNNKKKTTVKNYNSRKYRLPSV